MIAPHTLSNFQSLKKLIILIINHFYSHCRSDWQIALTKQNFSDTLLLVKKERKTGLEPATSTLGRLRSTN